MKKLLKIFVLSISIAIIVIPPLPALEIKDRNEYLTDAKNDDGSIYLNRFSAHKKSNPSDIKISFFGETQWNFKTSEWEKLTAGVEIGKAFWKYLYIAESPEFIAGQMLDYAHFKTHNRSIETVTKIVTKFPIFKNSFSEKLNLRLFEEYTYNLEKGRVNLNEVGAEMDYMLSQNSSIGIGWRHTDRIHTFDTDYVTSSFTLHF